jgi:hypothetical protein
MRHLVQALEVGEYPLYRRFILRVTGGVAGEASFLPLSGLSFYFPNAILPAIDISELFYRKVFSKRCRGFISKPLAKP